MGVTFGSLFAGIGGFDLALERAGFSCAWQVEIEPRAQDVLRYHWPDVERFADVREVGGATLAPVDLICGGFPCQDLSVAGRRAGLGGERSGLFWQLVRVVSEVRPRWLLLENVGGLLSSNGWRDLGTVLGALGECGYWWTYRCLDSQHFGVPQRRYRIFIVGHLGAPCPAEVLLEPDCLPGDLAAREQAREDLARPIGCGSPRGSGYRNDADTAENLAVIAASETGAGWWSEGPAGLRSEPGGMPQTVVAVPLRAQHNASHRADSDTYIAHTLRSEGADASEDGTGRGTPLVADTLRSHPRPGSNSVGALAFNWQSGGDGRQNASTRGTDALSVGQVPAVGFIHPRQLRNSQSSNQLGIKPDATVSDSLTSEGPGAVHSLMGVRRLTPRECERLQSLPDDWTRYGRRADGSVYELADAPRYRALGNAVTANVVEWIARRIIAAEAAA